MASMWVVISLSSLCASAAVGEKAVVWDTHAELMQWIRVLDPGAA